MRKFLRSLWRLIFSPFRLILWLLRSLARFFSRSLNEARLLLTEDPEDEPLPETLAKTIQNPIGLLEHVDALRKHLLRALLVLIITTGLSFTYTPRLIDIMAGPVGGLKALQAIDVTEPIGVFMRVALLCGFALALPYIAFELWLFAAPGLKKRSRFFGLIAIPIATLFFLGGIAFAYYVLLPTAIPFMVNFMGFTTQLRPSSYVRFVTSILFWIGIFFEFPLVIYALALAGLVKARFLLNQWRLAVVIIAVLAAAITPTVDPVNMGLVMGPMMVLYFVSIGLAYLAQARQPRQASETG
ncbi:MAG: twin-arginine translocase subunit TatC [Anaerolineales bacterium]|nr:twin-arginine translocase subunit TatC [Anaerolineales bacterium]